MSLPLSFVFPPTFSCIVALSHYDNMKQKN